MKWYFYAVVMMLMTVITSCANHSLKIDDNLSKEEAEAVVKTEKSLPRGAKIINYQIARSYLPLALSDTEYKNYRDKVYKARIDYRTNTTRNLTSAVEKNLETLKNVQAYLVEKDSSIQTQSPEYIFVLADVEERQRKDGKLSGYIAVFDPSNFEQVDLIQVTEPLYNNAVMVTEALNGTLANPKPEDVENLKSTNPVVNFILRSNPK